jgi:hypothetical protein
LKHARAPPRCYGQRHKLVERESPRGLPRHCADKAGNIFSIFSVPLRNCRVVIPLLRQHRGDGGSSLGTTARCLGAGLGTTIKYLRQRRGAAGNTLGNTFKYLRRKTSGASGNGLSRYRGLLIPQSPRILLVLFVLFVCGARAFSSCS